LCKLVQTHPYGLIHGGTLSVKEWQRWYNEVAEALEPLERTVHEAHAAEEADGQVHSEIDPQTPPTAVEADVVDLDMAALLEPAELSTLDSDRVNMLRLRKRYYSDALAFIASVAKAVPMIADLLTSKVKSEALEAMEFFCIAHEYNIEGADVRVNATLA
jgi:condensin complex subunit 1